MWAIPRKAPSQFINSLGQFLWLKCQSLYSLQTEPTPHSPICWQFSKGSTHVQTEKGSIQSCAEEKCFSFVLRLSGCHTVDRLFKRLVLGLNERRNDTHLYHTELDKGRLGWDLSGRSSCLWFGWRRLKCFNLGKSEKTSVWCKPDLALNTHTLGNWSVNRFQEPLVLGMRAGNFLNLFSKVWSTDLEYVLLEAIDFRKLKKNHRCVRPFDEF